MLPKYMQPKQIHVCFRLVLVAIFCLFCNPVFAGDLVGRQPLLLAASELDYPPFALVRPDGSGDGFSVELLKAVAQVIDLKVNLVVGPWHEIKQKLEEGRLDVLPLVSYTPERDKVFDFTVPYLQMHGSVFIRKGEQSIRDLSDLKDKKVLVMRDDTAHEYAVNHNLSTKLILTDTYEEAMLLLSSGKYDAVLCQYVMGLQLIKQLDLKNLESLATKHKTDLKPRGGIITDFEQKFCLAVPEGRKELLAQLNEGLTIVFANGTYDKLYHKWFGPILPKPVISMKGLIETLFLVFMPILLLLAAGGVWYLKREVFRKTGRLQVEIHERMLAEKAIVRSERLLAETASIGKVGGWEFNIATEELVWTDETYRIHEVSRTYTPTVKSAVTFYTSDSLPVIRLAVERAIDLGEPFDLELEIITGKSNLRYIHVLGKADRENNRVYGFVQDITDRRLAENDVREGTERFRVLFDNAPIGYQSLNEDGCFLEVNQTWLDLLGYTRDEILGQPFVKFIHRDWQVYFLENFPRLKVAGEIAGAELELVKKDGLSVSVALHGKISKTANGSFGQTHCVLHDMTKVKQAEKEKTALESQLRQSLKMEAIGTLAGGIAHDFNNILAAILGYADMALDDIPDTSHARPQIEQVVKAGNRAKELVKKILSFSRKEPQQVVPMKLNNVVREALELLRASIPKTVQIHQNLDATCGNILADPTQIHQIVMNLCTNAIQAMNEEEGFIKVTVSSVVLEAGELVYEPHFDPGLYAHLSVTDNGIGIGQEHLDRIFDPYYTTKGTGEGSGMGLAVVVGIVKGNDGMITVVSTPGKGTTFNVYFPKCDEQIKEEVREVEPLPAGSEKILVVDDEESLANMTKLVVERLGYQVTAITNSMEALELFCAQPDDFDLVITDQKMPELTGEKLVKRLKDIKPKLPIIICTGYSSKIDFSKVDSLGISAFLMKPVPIRELAQTIRQVLDEK